MDTPGYVKDFWANYGEPTDLTEVECDDNASGGSLANHVLETFNIPVETSSSSIGGNLKNLDIKRMDAMSVITLSLLEEAASIGFGDSIYEPVVNEEGEVEFVEIGSDSASLDDIYHQIQSAEYKEECAGVLVKGGQRLPEWKPLDWKYIWQNGPGDNYYKEIYDTTEIDTGCLADNYSTHATIVFNDPHLSSEFEDGINNLFEINGPFEKIIGYVRFCHVPSGYKTPDTKVKMENSTVVPIKLADTEMGTLADIQEIVGSFDLSSGWSSSCWDHVSGIPVETEGVKVPISDKLRFEDIRGNKVDKFVKVENVYLQGLELSSMQAGIKDGTDPSSKESIVVINIDKPSKLVFELSEGEHYVVKYKDSGSGYKDPYIAFAKNARVNEPSAYGTKTNYVVGAHSNISTHNMGDTGQATIFPLDVNKGVLVYEIIIKIRLESPSITVYDPHSVVNSDGEVEQSLAYDIADNLEYVISPIIVYEPPPTMAFNDLILDQTLSEPDNDPTTVQDFTVTPYEEALDVMAGGQEIEITLPFLNEESDDDKIKEISKNLKTHMDHKDGIETTYVCGPDTEVKLGESGPTGGIINQINYSYSDSGSYTISVNEGPRLMNNFSSGGPSGPSFKSTETFSSRGTVVDSVGDGIFHKVRIDGYGERIAVSMADSIIRKGDVVNCTVHNNAVEA